MQTSPKLSTGMFIKKPQWILVYKCKNIISLILGLWIQHWYKTEKVSPLFPGTQLHNPLQSLPSDSYRGRSAYRNICNPTLWCHTFRKESPAHALCFSNILFCTNTEGIGSACFKTIDINWKKIDVGKKEKAGKGHHSKVQSIEIRIKWDYDKRWKSGIKQPTSPIPLACSWFFSCYKLSFWEPEQPAAW